MRKMSKKTHLMQRACLDWRNFQRYFNYLLDEGFIKYNPDNGNFMLTEKGSHPLDEIEGRE